MLRPVAILGLVHHTTMHYITLRYSMAKTDPLQVRLDPEVRAALDKAAKEDMRPVSHLAAKLIADGLRKSGHLSKEKPRK
jgi:hypothetical protein